LAHARPPSRKKQEKLSDLGDLAREFGSTDTISFWNHHLLAGIWEFGDNFLEKIPQPPHSRYKFLAAVNTAE
jgi:hypothetical protein